jgi:tRNA(Ile)-lysidine synthase
VILSKKIEVFVARHKLIVPGDRVLAAVSGGPDSVALLHLLYDLREELGLHLEVAHLQHGIRDEEAREDARFVAGMAEKLGLPFHLKEVNVPKIRSAAGRGNLEQLARDERYRFFAEVARRRRINKVAVGHTEDDQAETVLMWFLRGSGLTGLRGMSPMRPLEDSNNDHVLLIRPLLGISKDTVLEFLREKQIGYRVDHTNQDTNRLRNWIRQCLLPQLKVRLDAQLPGRLSKQAELIRDEDVFLERLARHEFDKIRGSKGIDRKLFVTHAKAMQRRILRRWIEETRGHLRGIDFVHVDELLKLIENSIPQSRITLPGGWELLKEYEILRLEKRSRSPKRLCYQYELHIGRELKVPEADMTIRSEYIAPPLQSLPEDFTQAVFDAAALPTPLFVRNFRRGDRFRPLGMTGHRKVKDLFIEKKVPLLIRATLPLLSAGEEIIWIPGFGRAEIGKIHPQTASIIRLTAVCYVC